jgi:hypothetical protein
VEATNLCVRSLIFDSFSFTVFFQSFFFLFAPFRFFCLVFYCFFLLFSLWFFITLHFLHSFSPLFYPYFFCSYGFISSLSQLAWFWLLLSLFWRNTVGAPYCAILFIYIKKSSPMHVAAACAGSRKRSDHFGQPSPTFL